MNSTIYFIYGLCVMFYLMMAWLFWRKGGDRLSRLVALLMAIIGAQCVKDLFFVGNIYIEGGQPWYMMTAIDMVAVPMYAYILLELCCPGWLTVRTASLHMLPFVILPALYLFTGNELFYHIEVGWAATYGTSMALWTLFAAARYNRRLKELFSYQENINLNWLRVIIFSFFIILGLWIVDCVSLSYHVEGTYLIGSLVLWMFICYFIYRHESVIDELHSVEQTAGPAVEDEDAGLGPAVAKLFVEEKLFLNPKLKLSDVARLAGTNRTYLSHYFNQQSSTTFYDYVNGLRIEYAEQLLVTTADSQTAIAEQSGFNSLSTFRRAFEKKHHCSPAEYRSRHASQ